MQVSVETTGPLEREMRVEVPEEQIATQVDQRLKSLSRTTKVRGFRPGKVPMRVIEQRFGDQVRREVIGEVVQSSFLEAINKENLRLAGRPHIHPADEGLGQGLVYTAKFEVLPDLKLKPVEKLKLKRPVFEVTDADVDGMVETLRRQRRRMEPVQRAAQRGDVCEVDFTGRVDGETFEGGESKGLKVEIGAGGLLEGFEDGLIGAQPGEERTLNLEFPGEYNNKELAGKPVEFQVKVNSVSEPVLPELNAEFYAEFGIKDGDAGAFRREISEHMEREATVVARNRLRDAVMEALHDANDVELPASMVSEEQERLRGQFVRNMKAYGVNMDEKGAEGIEAERFEPQAKKRVALQLIISEIVRQHGLKADPGRVRALIEKNASSYEDPSAVINWYYADQQRLAEVEALALEDAVIDWVTERAQAEDAPVSFDELMNKGQTESNG